MTDPPHVLFLLKGSLDRLPPCVSHMLALRDAGHDVTLLHGPSAPHTIAQVADAGIRCVQVTDYGHSKGRAVALRQWTGFRNAASRALREHLRPDSVLWCGTGDTALAMYDVLMRYRRFVLTLLELYDTVPHYRRTLAPLARRAGAVVVAERTRAQILQSWWDLNVEPITIPNKPFTARREPAATATTTQSAEAIAAIGTNRVILYQGLISPERDLRGIAAATLNHPTLRLAVMGPDYQGHLDELRRINPSLLHLPTVPAPAHLEVTSHAAVGVATYQGHSLNTLFCAPNKVFEYAAYGIPILANEVPGLRLLVGATGAGVCVDTDNPSAVRRALDAIDANYDTFGRRSRELFDETDVSGLATAAVTRAAGTR